MATEKIQVSQLFKYSDAALEKEFRNIYVALNRLYNRLSIQSATEPDSPTTGQIWNDTATNTWKIYNGTTWDQINPAELA